MATVDLTARALNRATLRRQLLLGRERLDPVEAVRRVVALQAQEPVSPYVALWNRVHGFDPAAFDGALATQAIVKTSLMRITLHAVTAEDYPAFHEAMQVSLRAARLNDRRFTAEGIPVADVEALVPELLEFAATPRTNAEMERWMEQRFGSPKPRVWWALRHYGPFVHAATGGPWSFGPRPGYTAAVEQRRPGDAPASTRYLVRRYLEGFGPATVQDIAQFSTIYRPPIHEALRSLGDELIRHTGPTGEPLYDVPDGVLPAEDSPAPPRLMAMWDSALLAYADRSRIMPPDYRTLVMRNNGDVLPTLLVDGYVAGVWRPVEGGIEATAFHRLGREVWKRLEAEASALTAFLEPREPLVYRRYGHWWDALPTADRRVLGA
ncbi:MAG: winged helix DNA-binding domain-containing protein [Chloroflexota bacterium]